MKRILLLVCLVVSQVGNAAEVTLEWATSGIVVPEAGQVTDITVDAVIGGEYLELHGVANVPAPLLPIALEGTGFITDTDIAVLTLDIIENVYLLRIVIDLRARRLSGTVDLVHETFGVTGSGRVTLTDVRCGKVDQEICDALDPTSGGSAAGGTE